MHYFWLIFTFLIITGIAVFYSNLLKTGIAEGMIPAVLSVVLILGSSITFVHTFAIGMVILLGLAISGVFIIAVTYVRNKEIRLHFVKSPYFITLCCILLFCMVIYAGDTVRRVDELRLWALAPKYLLSYETVYPSETDYWMQGTVIFECFFLRIAGFKESSLYIINALLCWIGLLLPFGRTGKSEWKRLVLYVPLVYLALYSLYIYGTKTCSPELPMACWAGGLSGWWLTRTKKKTDLVILASGLAAIGLFSSLSAVALLPLIVLFALAEIILIRPDHEMKYLYPYGLIVAGAVFIVGFFCAVLVFIIKQDNQVISEAWPLFIQYVFERSLTLGTSNLNYTFLFGLSLDVIILLITGRISGKKRESVILICYTVIAGMVYLFVAFINLVSDEYYYMSSSLHAMQRSISVFAIYLFILFLVWMLINWNPEKQAGYIGVSVALLLVFIYGINLKYLNRTTAIYPEQDKAYPEVEKVKEEHEYLLKKVSDGSRVYVINQGKEISSAAAYYYLGDKINDCSRNVWKYTAHGGMVKDHEDPYKSIEKLPKTLIEGKYNYVWIYKSDKFLNTYLPMIMGDEAEKKAVEEAEKKKAKKANDNDFETDKTDKADKNDKADQTDEALINEDDLAGGQLYKVVKKKGKTARLVFVDTIKPYDNREEYYSWNNMKQK